MADEDTKYKHSQRRKRNMVKKDMFSNDRKGAYAIKVIDARKPEYERVKLRPNVVAVQIEDEVEEDYIVQLRDDSE